MKSDKIACMDIEFEAKFLNINKENTRTVLRNAGAKLLKPEFLQKRVTFNLPKGHEVKGTWVRVRNETDKITMSLKIISGEKIEYQKEITLKVDNFEKVVEFLKGVGCEEKSYQENKRELWLLDDVEITIDEWPFIEPFVELEGKSEEEVRKVSEMLGFNWKEAVFGSTHLITSRKYNIPEEILNDQIPRIVFNEENPYLAWKKKNNQ